MADPPPPPPLYTLLAALLLLAMTSAVSAAVADQRYPNSQESVSVKGVVTALRSAFVGSQPFLGEQRWEFDPEVSARRSREFQRLHGPRAQLLIERLGLGEDGLEEERRVQQAIRDRDVPISLLRRR